MFNYKLIKHLRKLHNVSQVELAEKINVSRGTIANYEIGNRTPDFTTLIKICDVFNVSMDLFIYHNTQQTERELIITLEELLQNETIKKTDKQKLYVSICEIFERYGIKKK